MTVFDINHWLVSQLWCLHLWQTVHLFVPSMFNGIAGTP